MRGEIWSKLQKQQWLCFALNVATTRMAKTTSRLRGGVCSRGSFTSRDMQGIRAESSAGEGAGHGAIFEISRILDAFDTELRERNLNYSVGLILGGSNIEVTPEGKGSVEGKPNIIAGAAFARGDIRALTPDALSRAKDKMFGIVAKSLPGTSAQLQFSEDGYPPMAPTAGNKRLLSMVNTACKRAGIPEVAELDPMERAAGDSSFIAPYTDCLSGFGAVGEGSHAPGESIDLSSLSRTINRAAVAINVILN